MLDKKVSELWFTDHGDLEVQS